MISVSISCGESGEKSKLRRDSDGLFSFVSYQYCQRQNNKGRQQNKAGVQNNHAVHIRTGESGTGGLCEVRCSCIGKELSHQFWPWGAFFSKLLPQSNPGNAGRGRAEPPENRPARRFYTYLYRPPGARQACGMLSTVLAQALPRAAATGGLRRCTA